MTNLMRYSLLVLAAVVFTFLIHEFAHWLLGEMLGNNMSMTLNTAFPASGRYKAQWHYNVISLIGPLTGLLQAIIFYLVIRTTHNKNYYPLLFMPFYLELLSGVMNLSKPNDLGRISLDIGTGLFTLSLVFVTIHFMLVYFTSKREGFSKRFNLQIVLLTLLFSSIWILVNNKFHVVIIS